MLGTNRGREHPGKIDIERPESDEVVQAVVGETTTPYVDDWPCRDGHHGGEAATVGEAEVELRLGRVEPPLGKPETCRGRPDHRHEFVVVLGDGPETELVSVRERHERGLRAVHVDVLDHNIFNLVNWIVTDGYITNHARAVFARQ